jgi:hypothetical protein
MKTEQRVLTETTGAGQREAVVTWLLWGLLFVMMLITYSRLEGDELYRVSRGGFVGGLSRVLVLVNFPIALVAIALVLVAMEVLPRRAWSVGVPAIVLCIVTAVPGVVDDHDLDARPVNAVPAIGVALAIGLTVAAARRGPRATDRTLPLDRARWVAALVTGLISLPWLFADLGFYAPEWVFIMERPFTGSNGSTGPAVHLGHHHGFDGALLVITAILLSRVTYRSRRLTLANTLYVSLIFAYGAINFVQDAWNEQLVKRGWVDQEIPGALNPALEPIWLVILVIAAASAAVLRSEQSRLRRAGHVTEGPADHVHNRTGWS